jgi:3-oxoacyl-[acyl-carrier protein] reductase
MDTDLDGQGVLVTGGAGGIGSAIVRAFAREGAKTAIHYLTSKDRAEALASEVGGIALQADLTVETEVDELVPVAVERLGRLDVLVANAGHWPEEDVPVWEMTLDRWRATLAINLDGVFLSCRAFLRHVAATGSGNIVIIGSTAGIFGEAGHADYAASKSAVVSGLTRSLKNEIVRVASTGRVNAVCPGWTQTDMTRDVLADESVIPRVTRTMALKKLATADDVASAVVVLASDRVSGHITGEVITVAGGMEGRVIGDV